jgi:hypothetical protein
VKFITPQDIISDEEVTFVHGNSNFGKISNRAAINESVLSVYVGMHIGSTARSIVIQHGLVYNSSKRNIHKLSLTKKGKNYVKAIITELVVTKSIE